MHVASRLTASAMVLRRRGALKPCAFGLGGLTAPLRRKAGIDAVNGSLCLSLTWVRCRLRRARRDDFSANRNFPLDIGSPIQGES
jgi:hypothetical protein